LKGLLLRAFFFEFCLQHRCFYVTFSVIVVKMRSYFEVEGRKVYPVETSAYQTVNFSKDENIILATTGLSGCYS
jgi:hypothetical protein